MLFDVRKLFSTYEVPVTQQFVADLTREDFPGYTVPQPVNVTFKATISGSVMHLLVSFAGEQQASCARCLDAVNVPFSIEREFMIRNEEWAAEEPELPFHTNGKLDMQELAYTELVLELPTVLLCSEECEGICPGCGNRKPCACTHETTDAIDPRLSQLKELLNEL